MPGTRNINVILALIVVAQFTGTSLWFAGNAILPELSATFGFDAQFIGHITSAVQIGFVAGTLTFAFLTISDRMPTSRVFFISALLGAVFNFLIIFVPGNPEMILVVRFMTGFFLAGIYPVGMKIAADWHEKGLGRALGFLVGALVFGKSFPYLIQSFGADMPWKYVLIITSLLAVAGGFMILLFVPQGPFARRSAKPDFSAFFKVFRAPKFRSAAMGYFGHMWELYTFWAFLPVVFTYYSSLHPQITYSVPLMAFIIIALGGAGCIAGGFVSLRQGSHVVAFIALLVSGLCCLISPVLFDSSWPVFLFVFIIWGLTVVTDSPQFSTLVAQTAPADKKGTALTIVNSVGFALTIPSIQLINYAREWMGLRYVLILLAAGPLFGLIALYRQFPPHRKLD